MSSVASYIKNTADKVFSQYIRLKDADSNGYCRCISCGVIKPYSEMDAGHFVGRGKKNTRYDTRNVHPQCRKCNRFMEGNKSSYAYQLMCEYGMDVIEELVWAGNTQKQWRLDELKAKVKEWRAEIEKLSTVKG